jgi:hypothetical protein
VHDCFRVLPNYGNDLRRQYNLLLSQMAESNLLSSIVSQITGRKIQADKLDPSLIRRYLGNKLRSLVVTRRQCDNGVVAVLLSLHESVSSLNSSPSSFMDRGAFLFEPFQLEAGKLKETAL